MTIDVSKRQIGVNFSGSGEAEVIYWGPFATSVELVASSGTAPLQQAAEGYWKANPAFLKPNDEYQFKTDGENLLPDPASLRQRSGVHGPSTAIDITDAAWTDDSWQNIPLDKYIIYELHTGTFTPDGNFKALEEKLDHLLKLGITAIEIMPVAQFPGGRNWGYDGVYPFSVQDSYGGADDLQRLVNTCHQKNIAVILDVVYNHIGPEGNYLSATGPYFTDKYHTPWGNAINFDDAWSDGVRNFFIENALMWFRDFHIDALRLDAVHAIKDNSPVHILREIKDHTDKLMELTGKTHYLIAELDLNDNRYINPVDRSGYGMDAQWIDEFHHALRVSAGQPRDGYYADFNGVAHLAKAYNDAYVYDGQFSGHRQKKFGVKAGNNPGAQFVVFSQNHDQVGNRMLGERSISLVGPEMQKLMAMAVFVSPYIPMLFMGEEYGETHPFQYFVSHTDPALAEAVREGRKSEFKSFHIEGETPDPLAEDTFQHSKLQWELLHTEPHITLFSYYQQLIIMRKTIPALNSCDRSKMSATADEKNNTVTLNRFFGQQRAVCLMNFSSQTQPMTLPENAVWNLLLDSASAEWNGPGSAGKTIDGIGPVLLQPRSGVIYTTDDHP